ncbi:hypothetical protein ACSBR1_013650 [Camellia fascicularis]
MAMLMVESIVVVVGVVLLMLLLILLLILLACKPWRFFLSPSPRTLAVKSQVDDIERPLVSEGLNFVQNQSNEFAGNYALEGTCNPTEQTHGVGYKQQISSTAPQLTQGGNFVLDVIPNPLEDIFVGQTLKRPLVLHSVVEEQKHARYDSKFCSDSDSFREFVPKGNAGSNLTLEVISGLSRGLRCSVQSTNASRLPLTIGRVVPSDLLLKDSEISGKHALINWNLNDSEKRHWGQPIELANGDTITLGTSTKVSVRITSQTERLIPFGVGLASDPMAVRRGGKMLPMEDVCYYHWPLLGTDQFGLFGICDGHGGVAAATSASKMLPEMVASILSDSSRRERVLSQCDASDVLRDAFLQTEAGMNHYYEGCTATVLLVWADGRENFFVQCANVGDSACVMNIDGKQIKMSEDHRISSYSERLRMQETGEPLKDGDTRLCGLNLGRMLGDKFLKQQEARFSSEPYISEVVHIHQASKGFALLASDGFWDVVNFKKAIQLVEQAREGYVADTETPAEKIANFLLNEARTQRTKDNTSVIFLDFDSINRIPSCKLDS